MKGRAGRALLGIAVLLHLTVVFSIVSQPLDVNSAPPGARSFVWPLFNDAVHRKGPGADFFSVYHAGVQVWRGADPYASEENPPVTPYYYPFRYLPAVAATLGVAFGALAPGTAYRVWVVVLEGLLAGVILLLWRRAQTPWLRLFTALVLLGSAPYFLELHMGQFSFATLAFLSLALVLVEEEPRPRARSTWMAAGAYAAAALLKVFPLVTLPAVLKRRSGWICGIAAVLLLAAANLPYFLGTAGLFRTFVEANFAAPGGFDSGNHGLVYLIRMAGQDLGVAWDPDRWRTLALVWQAALLIPASCLVLLSRHPSAPTLGGGFLVLVHTLTYVHVWEHHSSGVLVAALLMLPALARADPEQEARGRISWSVRLAAASIVLLALPTPFALFDRALDVSVVDPSATWPAVARYLMPLCKTVPMVILLALGWRELAGTIDSGTA